jgi:hypothetical protein
MMEKTRLFFAVFVCAVALDPLAQAAAGEVKLVSDTIDMICRVEVTSGADAPEGPVETHTDVIPNGNAPRRPALVPKNCL